MTAFVRRVLGTCSLLCPALCIGLDDGAALVQESFRHASSRQPAELVTQAEQVLESIGPLELHQRPTLKDKESLMRAQALMKNPMLLKLYMKKAVVSIKNKTVSDSKAASSAKSASSGSSSKSAPSGSSSSRSASSSSSSKPKAASASESPSLSSSGHHHHRRKAHASSSSSSSSSKSSSASSSHKNSKRKHKASASSSSSSSSSVASSSHKTTTHKKHKAASSNSSSPSSTHSSSSEGSVKHHEKAEMPLTRTNKTAGATHAGSNLTKTIRPKHKVREGACTSDDESKIEALGGGSSKGSFPGITASCAKKSYKLFSGLDAAAFLSCLKTESGGISSSCGQCFAGAASYGVKNCAMKCMASWCSQVCLDCSKSYREGELSQCAGFKTPEATYC